MTSRRRTTRKTPPLTVSSSTPKRGRPRTGGPAPRTQGPSGQQGMTIGTTKPPRASGGPAPRTPAGPQDGFAPAKPTRRPSPSVSGGPAPRSKVTPKPKRLSSGPRGRAFHYEYK
jgi:hypothetical protein